MDIEGFLSQSELFSELSTVHMSEILKEGRLLTMGKNSQIFGEGEAGNKIFLLLEGSVKLFKLSEDGRDIIVRILTGGELFGEVVLYLDDSYPVSAVTLEDSKLFTFTKQSFYGLMDHEDFRNDFISVLMKKQRYLSGRIHYLSAYDVEERFFRYLRENYGEKEKYRIDLSRKDLASAIGTIPETLSRLTARLKKRGLISWDKKELMLKQNFWREFE